MTVLHRTVLQISTLVSFKAGKESIAVHVYVFITALPSRVHNSSSTPVAKYERLFTVKVLYFLEESLFVENPANRYNAAIAKVLFDTGVLY